MTKPGGAPRLTLRVDHDGQIELHSCQECTGNSDQLEELFFIVLAAVRHLEGTPE